MIFYFKSYAKKRIVIYLILDTSPGSWESCARGSFQGVSFT